MMSPQQLAEEIETNLGAFITDGYLVSVQDGGGDRHSYGLVASVRHLVSNQEQTFNIDIRDMTAQGLEEPE